MKEIQALKQKLVKEGDELREVKRKQAKINALKQLLMVTCEPDESKLETFKQEVSKFKNIGEVKAGLFSRRTRNLLKDFADEFKAEDELANSIHLREHNL